MADKYAQALSKIDAAHAEDPNKITVEGTELPYELHYAQKCRMYLTKRSADASPVLRIAVRAQHFRRWEIPRSTYPMTKPGYHAWRTFLKKRQGELAAEICLECGISLEESERVAALIRKENMKKDVESQILEDVACLVFLDDQFEAFEKEFDEDKIVRIVRMTWGKMSEEGHALALQVPMGERCKEIVGKALAG